MSETVMLGELSWPRVRLIRVYGHTPLNYARHSDDIAGAGTASSARFGFVTVGGTARVGHPTGAYRHDTLIRKDP